MQGAVVRKVRATIVTRTTSTRQKAKRERIGGRDEIGEVQKETGAESQCGEGRAGGDKSR